MRLAMAVGAGCYLIGALLVLSRCDHTTPAVEVDVAAASEPAVVT